MKMLPKLLLSFLLIVLPEVSFAQQDNPQETIKLSYSDGRNATHGVKAVNKVLRSIGVRVSRLPLPETALPILKVSNSRPLNADEKTMLLDIFALHRGELLEQIELAGRKPEAHRGGFVSSSEVGGEPYPKVYDLRTLTADIMTFANKKYGKLHVNSDDSGMGIDEVATLLSGGPWTWFFVLPDNVIAKLSIGIVGLNGNGLRISYPGLVPHGGFLDARYGVSVAYAHGPKNFVMRYDEPSVKGAELLGTNAWIDFTGKTPKQLNDTITNKAR
ncbi:hypothetical protein [Shewanella atlantica]|uniref:Uncharacterized protein n=1 Tax=Shewanella atlantica TaxID=271099 RepID=A0A431WCL7_9GAMM|nr:hypothetical protein [Shewanella atlantica]RTR33191.1 hypothetical protein EKG39_05430 [Shewanella atlantica]